jgi:sporulation protein YunB
MQKKRKHQIIVILLIIIILVILYTELFVTPLITTIADEEIQSEVINIINYSNEYLQSLALFYSDYFTIYFDNDNKVSTIIANTGLINQVNMILQELVQNQLNTLRTKKITMPAGTFTGSSLLSNFGVAIPINIETICNSYTKIENSYESMGINQVRHSLKIILDINIEIIIPTRSHTDNVYNEIVLAENIIMGDIPETLLLGDSMSNYLDLVPD